MARRTKTGRGRSVTVAAAAPSATGRTSARPRASGTGPRPTMPRRQRHGGARQSAATMNDPRKHGKIAAGCVLP
eukprot:8917953-Prorocentrum_lima.AAC.1